VSQIKLQDIKARLEVLNTLIAPQGIEVLHGRRYGYNALDLYHKNGEIIDTLASGMTRAECYNWINAAIRGIDLYTYKTSIPK